MIWGVWAPYPKTGAAIAVVPLLSQSSTSRQYTHARLQLGPLACASAAEVIARLEVHPKLGCRAEIFRQPQRDWCSDRGTTMHKIIDARRIDVDIACEPILADAVRLHEFLDEDFTGRDGV